MLMPSWLNIHDGNLMDSTAHSFFTGCSHTLLPPGGKNMIKPFVRAGNVHESNLGAKPSAIELTGPGSTKEEIRGVYNDISQLWRFPGKSPCDEEMEEHLCWEILDSIKEHLWCKQNPALPEEPRFPPSTPRLTTASKTALTMTSLKIQHKVPVQRP